MTDISKLSIRMIIRTLLPFITTINRKGIIFCSTLTQTKFNKVIFFISLINHKWKGAIPNFIIMITIPNIFISPKRLSLRSKRIEHID